MTSTFLGLGKANKNMVLLRTDAVDCAECEEFEKFFPERSFNFGLSEGNMLGCAAGFALAGKLPFVVANAEFLLSRAFDQFYNNICEPNLNVKVVAMGKSEIDEKLARLLPNLELVCERETGLSIMAQKYGPMYFQKI